MGINLMDFGSDSGWASSGDQRWRMVVDGNISDRILELCGE